MSDGNNKTDWEIIAEKLKGEKLLLAAAVLSVAAFLSLFIPCPLIRGILAVIPLVLVDVYLVWVLFIGSVRSDAKNKSLDKVKFQLWNQKWYPIRTAGLLMVFLFFLTIVFGFATLYNMADAGFRDGVNSISHKLELEDSLFFSTSATVGFGDISPSEATTKRLVMWEISSCLLLLVGVVSFLISRITDFGSELNIAEKEQVVMDTWNQNLSEVKEDAAIEKDKISAEAKQKIIKIMAKLID